jgi:hypothetical protein
MGLAPSTFSFRVHRPLSLSQSSNTTLFSPIPLDSLLSYAKFISLRTPGSVAGSMWWSTDRQTFYLKGRPIQLHLLRTMAQEVVAMAERVLWEELLWITDTDSRPATQLAAIQDDITRACQPGTSVHRVQVNCISHVTLRYLLTHLGCVYNRSM